MTPMRVQGGCRAWIKQRQGKSRLGNRIRDQAMNQDKSDRTRLASSYNDLAQWPEWKCLSCGEWKPRMAFQGTRKGGVAEHCLKCQKKARRRT